MVQNLVHMAWMVLLYGVPVLLCGLTMAQYTWEEIPKK